MRTAYLLTTNQQSDRTQFSKKVLEKIGFNVICFQAIVNQDKVLSNKLSMMSIYDQIVKSDDEWAYVFEDDINMVEPIYLDEIIQYENISSPFFYLGCCMYKICGDTIKYSGVVINNYRVISISGGVRGLHGIGISKQGAKELLDFAKASNKPYMDCILEDFSIIHPANIVRFDLVSPYIWRHRGILFQDRKRFPSTI